MATVTCKIPDELNARLERAAKSRRVSKSALLRDALERRLRSVSRDKEGPTADDLLRHVRGTLRGPHDLSTNPEHLKDLGA